MGKQTRRIWRGFLVMMKFPKGALYHWIQWVRFALQKLSVTRPSRGIFFCSPFVVIVVQSVTTEVVTLRDNSNDYFATHSGWLGYSRKKSKGSFVIREGSFWILIVSSRGQLRPLGYYGYYWDYSFFIFEMILSSLLICLFLDSTWLFLLSIICFKSSISFFNFSISVIFNSQKIIKF